MPSMTESKGQGRTSGVALIVLGLVLLAAGLVLLCLPPVFHATVLLELKPGSRSGRGQVDPQTQLVQITSSRVLSAVASRLNLTREWSDPLGLPLTRLQAVGRLRERLAVAPGARSGLIEIRAVAPDPGEAADLANATAAAYLQLRQEASRQESSGAAELLRRNLARQTTIVSNFQQRIGALQVELGALATTNAVSQSPSAAEAKDYAQAEEQARVESELLLVETRLTQWESMNPQALREELIAALPDETTLPGLISDLDEVEQRLASLGPDVAPDDPELTAAATEHERIEQQIQERMNTLLATLRAQVATLRSQRDTLEPKSEPAGARTGSGDVVRKEATLARLQRDLVAQQKNLDALRLRVAQDLMERVDQTGVGPAASAEIVDEAEPPSRPDSPNRPLAGGLVALGFVVGVGGALVVGHRHRASAA
jgi:uncharacterized protein involved in exopolysaccharide biosynthesis